MSKKDDNGKTKVGNLGWMPIAGDGFIYEMQAKCLLLPGANGVPTWEPEFPGERATTKLPIYLKKIFEGTAQLNEEIGQYLAVWGAGKRVVSKENAERFDELNGLYRLCSSPEGHRDLEERRRVLWKEIGPDMQIALKAASDEALKKVAAAASPTTASQSSYTPGIDDPSLEGK